MEQKPLGIVSPVPYGEWSAGVTYPKLSIVRTGQGSYIARTSSTNVRPGVSAGWQTFWMLLNVDETDKAKAEADRAEAAADRAASDATAAAEAEVERLVGELGVVQDTGVSITSVMSQAGASRSFANALSGEESGGAVLCEDVSPVLHPVGVKVRSKNLFDKSKIDTAYMTETDTGFSFTNAGVAEGYPVGARFRDVVPTVKVGDTITFYADCVNAVIPNGYFYLSGSSLDWLSGAFHTITQADLDGTLLTAGNLNQVCQYNNVIFTKIADAPYTPYVADGTAVKVTNCGANLTTAQEVYKGADRYAEMVVDGRNCIRFTSGLIIKNKPITFNPNTQYTVSFYAKGENYDGATTANIGFSFFYEDGTRSDVYVGINAAWTLFTLTSDNGKTVVSVGLQSMEYRAYVYLDTDTFMLNEGSTALPYEPYKAGQTIDTTVGSTLDLESIAPYMSVYTDTEGTAVDVTYVKDTNAVIQKLVNAIVALGGNV